MRRHVVLAAMCAHIMVPALVQGQTTLHLHKETNASGAYLLRTAAPDAAVFAIVSPDYKNTNVALASMATFNTETSITGKLPANSVLSFSLWMKKSTSYSTVYPAVFVRILNGATICPWTNGSTALTTTLTRYTITCTTQSEVTSLAPLYVSIGRYFSVLPGNHSLNIELDVEGVLNGNYDSTLTIPPLQQGAMLTSVNPASGIAGDAVTVSGAGFGAQQGSNGLTFNGLPATVVSWSDSTVVVTIPAGATSGDLLAWVNGTPSNALGFTVYLPKITAVTPPGAPIGQTITITGTGFGATQGTSTATLNGVSLTIASWADTSITATIPAGATSGPILVTSHTQPSNAVMFAISPSPGPGSTFHLHKDASTTSGLLQLQSAGPDAASVALQTVDLKNTGTGVFTIKEFDTQAGVPNLTGVIPIGSTLSFTLWMKNTANFGVQFPRVQARLNASNGTLLCDVTGTTALTTTLTPHLLSCATNANITVTSTDRLRLWVAISATLGPGNHSVKGELDIEGVLNGNYDSQFTLPGLVPTPTLTALSVSAASVGQPITLTGSNFGPTQESSRVTFGGVPASVTTWSDTSIAVTVPTGATSGPVVVTRLQSSNALSFTMLGAIAGTTRSGAGAAVQGATIQVSQGGQVVGSATSNASGTFSISNLPPGSYEVAASAAGLETQSQVVTVLSGVVTNVDLTLRASDVIYSYDALNRLTSVTDGQGASARYVYDAVGNLLAIERYGSGTVAILSVAPAGGAPGTVVTIAGTGFASSAAQNSVQFNGVAASVLTSTPTQLTVIVPVGATTGLIAISTPMGSVTSGAPFVIDTSAGPPTITSFSPTSGPAGTAVTLNGTFDSVANVLKLNLSPVQVLTTAVNALSFTIPSSTGSGRFVVRTPMGTVLSENDFFVKPPSYPSYVVGFTARTTIGQPTQVTLPTGPPYPIGILAFDGVAGQRVSVKATNTVGTDNCLPGVAWAHTQLHTPYGLDTGNPYCNFNAAYTLPTTGTYSVIVSSVTSATITVHEVYDKTAAMGINQGYFPLTLDMPGQALRWTFDGVTGQPISLWLSPATNGQNQCYTSTATLRNPAGQVIATFNPCSYQYSPTYYTLLSSGLYTLSYSTTYGDAGGSASARVTSP